MKRKTTVHIGTKNRQRLATVRALRGANIERLIHAALTSALESAERDPDYARELADRCR